MNILDGFLNHWPESVTRNASAALSAAGNAPTGHSALHRVEFPTQGIPGQVQHQQRGFQRQQLQNRQPGFSASSGSQKRHPSPDPDTPQKRAKYQSTDAVASSGSHDLTHSPAAHPGKDGRTLPLGAVASSESHKRARSPIKDEPSKRGKFV